MLACGQKQCHLVTCKYLVEVLKTCTCTLCVLKKMLSKYQVVSVVLEGVLVVYKGKDRVDIVVSGFDDNKGFSGFQGRGHSGKKLSAVVGESLSY